MKPNGGWIKAWRKLRDNPCLKRADEKGLWLDLLLRASHKPTQVRYRDHLIDLKPGQLAVSVRQLARENGLSRKRATKILDLFKNGAMIGATGGPLCTVISVCNYDDYQEIPESKGHKGDHSRATRGATRGATEQEEKKRKKKDSPLLSPPKGRNGQRLSEDWLPNENLITWARDEKRLTDEGISDQADRFRDYWLAKAGAGATKLDWDRTFRNWIRKSLDGPQGAGRKGDGTDGFLRGLAEVARYAGGD